MHCVVLATLFALCPALAWAADLAPLTDEMPFVGEIRSFLAADLTNPPPRRAIVFVGSSSIRLWKSLEQDFPRHKVINRGFGGSQIIDSVNYFERIVLPYKPRQVVMYAGGNDINAGKLPQEVLADFQAFVAKVHQALPRARIAYISIAPNPARWTQVDRVRETNRLIENFARHQSRVRFINVFARMLGPDGLPRPEIFVADRLHMNTNGYALWKKVVGPCLD